MQDRSRIFVAAGIGGVAIAVLQWLNIRRASRLPPKARGRFQAIAERILPQSVVEMLPYAALAMTAGLCEEFLYRGFAMTALARDGLAVWAVILLSSILFGLAHLYQGSAGLVGTLLVGAVFGMARVKYDSLAPVIFWHTTLDLVAGFAAFRYLKGLRSL
jgi:hypothetical protein